MPTKTVSAPQMVVSRQARCRPSTPRQQRQDAATPKRLLARNGSCPVSDLSPGSEPPESPDPSLCVGQHIPRFGELIRNGSGRRSCAASPSNEQVGLVNPFAASRKEVGEEKKRMRIEKKAASVERRASSAGRRSVGPRTPLRNDGTISDPDTPSGGLASLAAWSQQVAAVSNPSVVAADEACSPANVSLAKRLAAKKIDFGEMRKPSPPRMPSPRRSGVAAGKSQHRPNLTGAVGNNSCGQVSDVDRFVQAKLSKFNTSPSVDGRRSIGGMPAEAGAEADASTHTSEPRLVLRKSFGVVQLKQKVGIKDVKLAQCTAEEAGSWERAVDVVKEVRDLAAKPGFRGGESDTAWLNAQLRDRLTTGGIAGSRKNQQSQHDAGEEQSLLRPTYHAMDVPNSSDALQETAPEPNSPILEVTRKDLDDMRTVGLQKLCKKRSFSQNGSRTELLDRLLPLSSRAQSTPPKRRCGTDKSPFRVSSAVRPPATPLIAAERRNSRSGVPERVKRTFPSSDEEQGTPASVANTPSQRYSTPTHSLVNVKSVECLTSPVASHRVIQDATSAVNRRRSRKGPGDLLSPAISPAPPVHQGVKRLTSPSSPASRKPMSLDDAESQASITMSVRRRQSAKGPNNILTPQVSLSRNKTLTIDSNNAFECHKELLPPCSPSSQPPFNTCLSRSGNEDALTAPSIVTRKDDPLSDLQDVIKSRDTKGIQDALHAMTNPVLKERSQLLGLATSGTKKQLVERLLNHIQANCVADLAKSDIVAMAAISVAKALEELPDDTPQPQKNHGTRESLLAQSLAERNVVALAPARSKRGRASTASPARRADDVDKPKLDKIDAKRRRASTNSPGRPSSVPPADKVAADGEGLISQPKHQASTSGPPVFANSPEPVLPRAKTTSAKDLMAIIEQSSLGQPRGWASIQRKYSS